MTLSYRLSQCVKRVTRADHGRHLSPPSFLHGCQGRIKRNVCQQLVRRPLSSSSSSTTSTTTSSSLSSKLRDLWNSGTILMSIGGAGLGLLAVDRALQYFDSQEATQVMALLQNEQAQEQRARFDSYRNAPALFDCTVKVVYKMGGTHGLQSVREGEVVQVLQEGVGPQGHYNLCRKVDEEGNQVSIGWYPIGFLEKKRRWWQWR